MKMDDGDLEDNNDIPDQQTIAYFTKLLSNHSNVESYNQIDSQRFQITRKTGEVEICVYITNTYTIGITKYLEVLSEYPETNCIITSSAWNKYTGDAKEMAIQNKIGLFDMGEFMGAMNINEYWSYIKKSN